jgi:hypothetical protein
MGEHRRRDREPELLGCLEVDHQLNLPLGRNHRRRRDGGRILHSTLSACGKKWGEPRAAIPLVSSPSASCSAGHYNRAGVAACGYEAARPTTGGNGEGPKPTLSGRSPPLAATRPMPLNGKRRYGRADFPIRASICGLLICIDGSPGPRGGPPGRPPGDGSWVLFRPLLLLRSERG